MEEHRPKFDLEKFKLKLYEIEDEYYKTEGKYPQYDYIFKKFVDDDPELKNNKEFIKNLIMETGENIWIELENKFYSTYGKYPKYNYFYNYFFEKFVNGDPEFINDKEFIKYLITNYIRRGLIRIENEVHSTYSKYPRYNDLFKMFANEVPELNIDDEIIKEFMVTYKYFIFPRMSDLEKEYCRNYGKYPRRDDLFKMFVNGDTELENDKEFIKVFTAAYNKLILHAVLVLEKNYYNYTKYPQYDNILKSFVFVNEETGLKNDKEFIEAFKAAYRIMIRDNVIDLKNEYCRNYSKYPQYKDLYDMIVNEEPWLKDDKQFIKALMVAYGRIILFRVLYLGKKTNNIYSKKPQYNDLLKMVADIEPELKDDEKFIKALKVAYNEIYNEI